MSRVRTVVLGVLLAVVSTLGIAPSASAAPLATGMVFQTSGSYAPPHGVANICPTGGSFPLGHAVQVQVLRSGAWVPVRTYNAPTVESWANCITLSPFDLVAKPGTYSFRAVTQLTPGGPTFTADATATLAPAYSVYVDAQTAEFTATTAAKVVTVTIDVARGQFVDLQRKDGTRWVHISRAAAPASGTDIRLRLPVATRVGQAGYRVVSQASAWTPVAVSPSFAIHQTDYVRYAAYIATARRYIASYCPKTPVSIDTPAVARGTGGNRLGLASSRSSWFNGTATMTSNIQLRSGMTGTQLAHVALHECAHVVQYRARVENKKEIDEQRARQIYGANSTEAQADCMAFLYSKSQRDMYYIRSCSAAQMTEGHRIWRAYGLKYQAATYVW